MGIFSYKDIGSTQSAALIDDALALSTYAYHNLDDGLVSGYNKYGFHAGLPLTLLEGVFGSTTSQGASPNIPWNTDSEAQALAKVNAAGWFSISASQLGYEGRVDSYGTFQGETLGYLTAQAEVMGRYDDNGQLTGIGIAFRGTSGPRGNSLIDQIIDLGSDAVNDVLAGLLPEGYANNYTKNAYDRLLTDVAAFAQANGLSGQDVIVTGHSLGGLAANSLAATSDDNWGGFYADANYIAFASPTQYELDDKVLNVGFENDPVFRVLDGTDLTLASLGSHDADKASATNNIVNFNDHYASDLWGILPTSIINIPAWLTHLPGFYEDGIQRIIDSEFYDLTHKDSTVVVSTLSDVMKGKTWVEDLNKYANPHEGSTFIIGTDGNDLIRGGKGNDYLEGRAGNDVFRDDGGYNVIYGGEGHNTFDLAGHSVNDYTFARSEDALYVRDAAGGISIMTDIAAIQSKESHLLLFKKDYTHEVTESGLLSAKGLTRYADSVQGSADGDVLQAGADGSWLFGQEGNDLLIGSNSNDVFVGGAGDDVMVSNGGSNSFLFAADFGHDAVYGAGELDQFIFIGNQSSARAGASHLDFAQQVNDDVVIALDGNSVTLMNTHLDQLNSMQFVFA